MEKRMDVTALGELLIDFTKNGESSQGNPLFEANPGGAPCNVLAMLTKLGRKTAFLGKVGEDMFGRLLKERVEKEGIDTSGLFFDREIPTTLAFVQTFENGDRDFSFYRKPGADLMLTRDEVESRGDRIRESKLFHFGTLSFTADPAAKATERALEIARDAQCLISFDPNYRPPLWESEEKAKEKMWLGMGLCDILKISDNEITFLTGETDYEKGIAIIQEKAKIPLIFATLGLEGSMAFCNGKVVKKAGFKNPDTIETTGAGDTFMACALNGVLEKGGVSLSEAELLEILTFANAAASIITTRRGALSVMPERAEVEELLKRKDRAQ